MSTAERSKRRQPDAKSASPLPASKRLKTTKNSHVPAASSGLGFLADADARHGKKLEGHLTNGVPRNKTTRVDESHAVVAPDSRDGQSDVGGTQDTAIDISSAAESSSDDSDEEEEQKDKVNAVNGTTIRVADQPRLLNGHVPSNGEEASAEEDATAGAQDVEMGEGEEDEHGQSPSFGDMLQARHPETIDVLAAFPSAIERRAMVPASGDRVLAAPTGTSLGTVLSQALKTNDKDLLESCFQTTDLPSIRSTIQRLQSQHVATLLQRIAERIHKRPGRTGNLMVWVQWSLVAHGGYLASQPDLTKQLKSLSQVIRERANGLQPLLHLKGKLDMLSAQLELRKNMQVASRARNADDDEDEDDVIYMEGQDEDWSDSDGADDVKAIKPRQWKSKGNVIRPQVNGMVSEGDSDGNDGMPNGFVQEADVESSEADEDEPGMFDIEAEVSGDDEDDVDVEDEEEEEDSDEEDDSASDQESDVSDEASDASSGVKQPQPKTLNRKR